MSVQNLAGEGFERKSSDSDLDESVSFLKQQHVAHWGLYSSLPRFLLLASLAAILLTAALLLNTLGARALSSTRLHCGNSTTEARSLGCEFDVLSNGWTPKECLDTQTSDEFYDWLTSPERLRPWPYYTDREGKEWIPDKDSLSEGVYRKLYTTSEQHVGHCVYLMRRLHRIVDGGGKFRLNSRQDYGHTDHCANLSLEVIGNRKPLDLIDVGFGVTFESC
jgi:hypothetical protein